MPGLCLTSKRGYTACWKDSWRKSKFKTEIKFIFDEVSHTTRAIWKITPADQFFHTAHHDMEVLTHIGSDLIFPPIIADHLLDDKLPTIQTFYTKSCWVESW